MYIIKYRSYSLPECAFPSEEGAWVGAYGARGFTFLQAIELIVKWKVEGLGAYYDYWLEPLS